MRTTPARHCLLVATVAAVGAAIAACGTSATVGRTAGVASTFGFFSSAPMPTVSLASLPDISPSTNPAPSTASSSPADGGEFASPTPCPLASPQIFVNGKSSASKNGTITFSYLAAQRLCGGPDDVQYETTGTVLTSSTVDPSAVVLLLPPDGSPDTRQVPAAALPAAMAANQGAPFYAITFGPDNGPIIRIEQYFHP